jgi:glycosyltransferase involved in cell wall biosynthesis
MKPKIIRITTVPISLKILLKDQLKFMNQHFNIIGVSSNGIELHDVEKNEDIQTIAVEMSREITPLKDIISLTKMTLLFLKEKPEIVHTHTPKAGIVGMMAAWIARVPHRLHTVAGLPVMEAIGKKKILLLWIEKLTYACATHVYPNSHGLEEYILKNKLTSRNKQKVIGYGSSNGIDTNYFNKTIDVQMNADNIRGKYNLEESFVFCFVGRVVKDKGINELIHAFTRLSNEYKSVKLLIVGAFEKDLDPISKKTNDILHTNQNIIHVGFQTDIRPYLGSSDCFVLPTYREGFPNVVLQACSMGLPAIVTNINGCNEIITDKKNGLIVEPKDESALYLAMKAFLQENTLAQKLSLNTRKDIIAKYDRKQFFQFLLEEYNKVLND